jgi:DNA helicase-2/ATP-dependent DNA helicase PcrA
MIDYQSQLNAEQYKVVTEADGPCLVLAGAGSGKTRTLVYRVAFLLEMDIMPENILLVTFTNKAANEMLERVKSLIGFRPEKLNGGTFHHMGNKILRKYADRLGYVRSFSIMDQDDSISVIKEVMQNMNLNVKGQNFPKPKVVQSVISYSNNTNGYPDFVAFKMDEIAANYRDKKKSANAMDFDDLLVRWLELLLKYPEIKDTLAKQFEYILVDEYQDTNYVQAAIIKELASFHNNVLVVGDDAQSIYSFRAADVNNILSFPKIFPNTKLYRIETNYRSTPQILDLANDSIKNNQAKFEKNLQPVRDDGLKPALIPARDVYQQAALVTNRIKELQSRGINYNSVAILFRATYHSAELQLELARQNIPYIVRG